ncbi:MAG: NAD(P)/FAD-dependent oxidoreductase [Spirochaetes bacterium]|nr:NAD(P)/FAD-dependent oxidoreductase [Spirochaetota bacterium]
MKYDIIIIGAGAAGLMAAHAAVSRGKRVLVLERKTRPGCKLLITGGGKCNVTHTGDMRSFVEHTVTNGRFLYNVLHAFSNDDLIAFFGRYGVVLAADEDGRYLPADGDAKDIIDALLSATGGAAYGYNARVERIEKIGDGFMVHTDKAYECASVIIACGGASYPATGSSGDGYEFAASFGHDIVKPRAALAGIRTAESWPYSCAGVSLSNAGVTLFDGAKRMYRERGDIVFTHDGVSGIPAMNTSSSVHRCRTPVLSIDVFPDESPAALEERLMYLCAEQPKRTIVNMLDILLPKMLARVCVLLCDIDGTKRAGELSADERRRAVVLLKQMRLTVSGLMPIERATVTGGGVAVAMIDAHTMMSKKIPGLFFAGEVIDVDALCGGYNLQIAFSTGYCAGMNA